MFREKWVNTLPVSLTRTFFDFPLKVRVSQLNIIFNNYSTSARLIWLGYNHHISNKHEWNNCFIKNAHKISRNLPDLICKNIRFSACFQFWVEAYSYHIWRAWYDGSYTMMYWPIRALVLHYPMIQCWKYIYNVVVQFYTWFKFYFLFCWGKVMYDNEFKHKGK